MESECWGYKAAAQRTSVYSNQRPTFLNDELPIPIRCVKYMGLRSPIHNMTFKQSESQKEEVSNGDPLFHTRLAETGYATLVILGNISRSDLTLCTI